jgi:pimeloyl-ACP methyl ester carboxylesterase
MTYRARSVPVTLDDGARTICDAYGERGPVVLCVHGISASRLSWARLGERLADTHRVFSYDQRGHGDSADIIGPMTLERVVRDLMTVARTLPTVDLLVGHCWGGAVVLEAARRLEPLQVLAVEPIIRVLPGTYERQYLNADVRWIFTSEGERREAALRRMFASLDPIDREAEVHAKRSLSLLVLERLGTHNQAEEGGWDLREAVVNYPSPLRIARAGVDSAISEEDVAFLRERGGPNVKIYLFRDLGRWLHRSAFEQFAALTADLARIPVGAE